MKKRTALTTAKSSVALLLFTLPLSSNLAYSAPSTTGEGNIVTGDHGVATGYNNVVTANHGLAQGNNSVATGGNISREEFKAILEKEKQTIADKNKEENALSYINTKIEANNKTAEVLNKRINELTELINQYKNDKENKITSLKNDLGNKEKELKNLKKEFEEAQDNVGSILASINSEGEFAWINYLKQIKKLDINKVTDDSNGTTGRQKLAADLKQLVEADYPNISGTLKKWNIDKYETILNGYLKARNSFGEDKDKIQNIIKSRNNQYFLDIGATSDLGTYANPDVGIVPDLLEKVNSVNSAALTEGKTIPNQMTKSFFSSNKQERYVQYSTLLNIINESNPNPINELNKLYNLNKSHNNNIDKPNNVANLVFYLPPIKHEKNDQINHSNFLLTSHTYYDPYSNPNDVSKYGHEGEGEYIRNTSKDTTKPSLYYYKTSKFFKDFFSGANVNYPKDVSQLREWVNRFYNDFYNLIDLNAPEDKWLFEKDDFLKQLKVVESFAKKISEYIAAYEEESKSPTEENVKKRELLYREIDKEIDNPKNYYENIEFKFKEST